MILTHVGNDEVPIAKPGLLVERVRQALQGLDVFQPFGLNRLGIRIQGGIDRKADVGIGRYRLT